MFNPLYTVHAVSVLTNMKVFEFVREEDHTGSLDLTCSLISKVLRYETGN